MRLIYLSDDAIDASGAAKPFLLQELPWLKRRFDHVTIITPNGYTDAPDQTRFELHTDGCASLRAALRLPFRGELYRELCYMMREHVCRPMLAARLVAFTWRGLRMNVWLRKALRGVADADAVVYSFWMNYDAYAATLARRGHRGLRIVCRGHAFEIDRDRNALAPYAHKRFILSRVTAAYMISRDAERKLLSYYHGPTDRLHVLPMGSRGEATTHRFPAPIYIDGVLRLVSCSSVNAIKRLPLLIDALAMQGDRRIRWMHIGGGPDEAAVRKYATQKLGMRLNIEFEFTGAVSNERVRQIYDVLPFDAFINTSSTEGVPVSIMEAMRAGLPVIAPRIGGVPDLVDAQNGYLFDANGGAQAVSDAIAALAALPQADAEQMREASQKRWNETFRNDLLLPRLFEEGEQP